MMNTPPTAMAMGEEGAQKAFAGIGDAAICHQSPCCDSRWVAMRWRGGNEVEEYQRGKRTSQPVKGSLESRCCCGQVASVVSDSVRPCSRQPTRLPRPWDSPGKNTGVGCHFLLQCMKVKVKTLSRFQFLATPRTAAHQAPPSMGFFRQEYWSGVPLPSPRKPLANTKKVTACFLALHVQTLNLVSPGGSDSWRLTHATKFTRDCYGNQNTWVSIWGYFFTETEVGCMCMFVCVLSKPLPDIKMSQTLIHHQIIAGGTWAQCSEKMLSLKDILAGP